jgi:hypothetical protein
MYYRIWKIIICVLFIIGCLMVFDTLAGYVDLRGADVVGSSPCIHNNKQFLCVAVEQDGKTYVVLLDKKGEYAIYLVGEKESVLIWYRDSV